MVQLDGRSLTLEGLTAAIRDGRAVSLAAEARDRMEAARRAMAAALAAGDPVYGVNTGFGDLANVRIDADRLRELQRRLLLSHAAGVGEPLPQAAVRAMLVLRANSLASGHSGVRPLLVERLLEMLRRDLLPVVPARGSVGASGDLAPLAHLALPLIGEGEIWRDGRAVPAGEVLAAVGVEPIELEPKEGLALINGTQAMAALLALAALAARRLVTAADLIGALSTDALRGTDAAFDARIHAVRPHPGQRASAACLWRLLAGSEIRQSHRVGDLRVQDPYSVRCMPQVHGAVRDVLTDVERRLQIEINSTTDNPLVFPESAAEEPAIVSGGNFHGAPLALAADFLCIALAELGSISERRVEKLTNHNFSGLPAFLVADPGVDSGFMIAHVTAASLVSENKVLAHPASVDSIPTSADKEDHVSMGMTSAWKLQQVVRNVESILAIELAAAAQGIDLLRPLRSSEPLESLHADFRRHVEPWREDRFMAPDLEAATRFLAEGVQPHLAALDGLIAEGMANGE